MLTLEAECLYKCSLFLSHRLPSFFMLPAIWEDVCVLPMSLLMRTLYDRLSTLTRHQQKDRATCWELVHSLSSLQIKRAALLSPGLARPLGFGEVYWRLLADLANLFQLWIVWKHQGQNIRTLKCGANLWHASRSNYAHNLPIISSWLSKAAAHYAISAWDCPQGKFCKWTSSECSS